MNIDIRKQKSEYVLDKFGKNFCCAPFTSLYEGENGYVYTCCKSTEPLGNINESTYEEILNSKLAKKIRKDFLEGKKPLQCNSCWEVEEQSLEPADTRSFNNLQGFSKINEVVDNIKNDGSIDVRTTFLDLLWSNKCNFACIGCKPYLSSTIATNFIHEYSILTNTDENDYFPNYRSEWNNDNIKTKIDFVIKNQDTIKDIHINGGEPLMNEGVFEFLEHLLKHNLHKKIKIWIHTNGSIKKYKGIDIVDHYLVHWGKNASIDLSIDGLHDKGNYIRYGFSQNKWDNFFKKISETDIKISTTICANIFNSLHLQELGEYLRDLYDDTGLEPLSNLDLWSDWTLNIGYVNLDKDTQNLCQQQLNMLQKNNTIPLWNDSISNIINFTKKTNFEQELVCSLLDGIDALDKKRNTDFDITFPELYNWKKSAKRFINEF